MRDSRRGAAPAAADAAAERVVDLEERAWLARHLRGDRHAFTELVRTYQGPVYRYLARCGLDGATRDDLLQEIFLRIHRAAGSYRPARPLRPWIFTIATNALRNHLRDERQRRAVVVEAGVDDGVPAREVAPGASTERVAAGRERLDWVERAIRELPLAQREVLVLACVEGWALAEVAESVGATVGTVKVRLHRARAVLARRLAELEGGGHR